MIDGRYKGDVVRVRSKRAVACGASYGVTRTSPAAELSSRSEGLQVYTRGVAEKVLPLAMDFH
jgi:hypothetical protein